VTDDALLADAREFARNGEGRRVREKSGVSLEELAAAAGMSVVDLMAWELGDLEPHGVAAEDYVRVVRRLSQRL
jgi:DNA-binding transcriptional regulator YiaG